MTIADLFDLFLVDLDGVVYVGDKPTRAAGEILQSLKQADKKVLFLTNDPRISSAELAKKLSNYNVLVESAEIISSITALSVWIKLTFEDVNQKNAYVIGTETLKEEMSRLGLELREGEHAKKSDLVILGSHSEFNYNEMKIATLAIRNGAHFFATNRDPFVPSEEGLIPGTGALLASIETASERKATVVGKPDKIMFDVAMDKFPHISKKRTAIVGDRLDTDIQGGKRAGIGTILALTGSTDIDQVSEAENKPDFVIRDLRGLLEDIDT